MAVSFKKLIIAALLFGSSPALAGEAQEPDGIVAALAQIRDAAIASTPDLAAPLFAEDLALVSQSGKLYGREAALFDLRNGFETWDNSDIVVREQGDTAIVTLVNNRTRTGMEPAGFLVMQVWRKKNEDWLLSAQSSVRIKE